MFKHRTSKQRGSEDSLAAVQRCEHSAATAAVDPVTHLMELPTGRMMALDDYRYEDHPQQWISVGSGSYCHIKLDDGVAESCHCLLRRFFATGRLCVKDDKAANRTLINGMPFAGEIGEVLPGDLITVGVTTFLACGQAGAAQPVRMGADDQERRFREYLLTPQQRPPQREQKTKTKTRDKSFDGDADPVRYLCESATGHLYDLRALNAGRSEIAIGADDECAIQIERGTDPSVSGRHCVLERRHGRWYVRDEGSHNGSFLNYLPVGRSDMQLVAGSLLMVGNTRFIACGRLGLEQAAIVLPANRRDYARRALTVYPSSPGRAARMIGVAYATLQRWLTRAPARDSR